MIDVWIFIAAIVAFAIFGFMAGIVVERDRDPRRRK